MCIRARIFVQVTIYRRLLIGRDRHLDQSRSLRYIVTCTRIRAQELGFVRGDFSRIVPDPLISGARPHQSKYIGFSNAWVNDKTQTDLDYYDIVNIQFVTGAKRILFEKDAIFQE